MTSSHVTIDQRRELIGPLVLDALTARGLRPIGPHWLMVDDTGRPVTINKARTLHRMAWATAVRETRLRWWHLATHLRVPRLEAVHVYAVPLHANLAAPQDVGACAPEAKAAVDGLVDAGVLIDDDPHHLRALTFAQPLICGCDGLALIVEDRS